MHRDAQRKAETQPFRGTGKSKTGLGHGLGLGLRDQNLRMARRNRGLVVQRGEGVLAMTSIDGLGVQRFHREHRER